MEFNRSLLTDEPVDVKPDRWATLQASFEGFAAVELSNSKSRTYNRIVGDHSKKWEQNDPDNAELYKRYSGYSQVDIQKLEDMYEHNQSLGGFQQTNPMNFDVFLVEDFKKMKELSGKFGYAPTSIINEEVLTSTRKTIEESEAVLEDSEYWGVEMAGVIGAAVTDPAVIATLPFGTWKAGGTIAANAGRAFLEEAGLEAAAQMTISPAVTAFKKELGYRQTLLEQATTAGLSIVTAGTIRAGASGIIDVAMKTAGSKATGGLSTKDVSDAELIQETNVVYRNKPVDETPAEFSNNMNTIEADPPIETPLTRGQFDIYRAGISEAGEETERVVSMAPDEEMTLEDAQLWDDIVHGGEGVSLDLDDTRFSEIGDTVNTARDADKMVNVYRNIQSNTKKGDEITLDKLVENGTIKLEDITPQLVEDIANNNLAPRIKELQETSDAANRFAGKYISLARKMDTHADNADIPRTEVIENMLVGSKRKTGVNNVYYNQKALQGASEALIPTMKQKMSTSKRDLVKTMTPFMSKSDKFGDDFIRGVWDINSITDPTIKKMVLEWKELEKFIKERSRIVDEPVKELNYAYFPQSHNPDSIAQVSRKEWIDFTQPLLREVYDVESRAGVPEKSRAELGEIYDSIVTSGTSKIKRGEVAELDPTKGGTGSARRELNFADAENWITYQNKHGGEDVMASVDNYIKVATSEAALKFLFGNEPLKMFESLKLKAKRDDGKITGIGGEAYLDSLYAVASGDTDINAASINKLADISQTIRAFNTATMLGKAALYTVGDLASLVTNTVYNGLSPLKVAGQFAKTFAQTIRGGNMDAIQAGLGADVFSSSVSARFTELSSTGFWTTASEATMRFTMLNIVTEAARKSFQVEKLYSLTKGTDFENKTMEEVIKMGEESLRKYIRILAEVSEEADYAVIMPTARSRAIATGGAQKGTGKGEGVRLATQFQSFTVAFLQQHGNRMIFQGRGSSKAMYAAGLVSTAMTLGYGVVALKDLSGGRTTREGMAPWGEADTSTKLSTAAYVLTLSFPLIGDLIFGESRFGREATPNVLGPTTGTLKIAGAPLVELGKMAVNIMNDEDYDKGTALGQSLVDGLDTAAFPTNFWYSKALMDSYVYDKMKIFVDDDYERSERRKQRSLDKKYGNSQFELLEN